MFTFPGELKKIKKKNHKKINKSLWNHHNGLKNMNFGWTVLNVQQTPSSVYIESNKFMHG